MQKAQIRLQNISALQLRYNTLARIRACQFTRTKTATFIRDTRSIEELQFLVLYIHITSSNHLFSFNFTRKKQSSWTSANGNSDYEHTRTRIVKGVIMFFSLLISVIVLKEGTPFLCQTIYQATGPTLLYYQSRSCAILSIGTLSRFLGFYRRKLSVSDLC